ncbi:phospholipase A1-Igamma1, chloroplastic-like [Nymphaea colorata]|nr:phospholipase A1-Igamma1, chloroplastic-like [Nymphaea colorata]
MPLNPPTIIFISKIPSSTSTPPPVGSSPASILPSSPISSLSFPSLPLEPPTSLFSTQTSVLLLFFMASFLPTHSLASKPLVSHVPSPISHSMFQSPSLKPKTSSDHLIRVPRQVINHGRPAFLRRHGTGTVRAQATDSTTKQQPEPKAVGSADLAGRWKEIQGCNDWTGLLDPIDPLLRTEVIRYGEFTQACYDSFDSDEFSSHCGTCRFDKGSFFEQLGMSDCGYRVNRYLYASTNPNIGKFFRHSKNSKAWSTDANWMGYVAVSEDANAIKRLGRRDILISWRGTVTKMEWIEDLVTVLKPTGFTSDSSIRVESGFLDLYVTNDTSKCHYCKYSAREQILAEVKRLVDLYQDEDEELSITITGHSLGGALALLSAYDIAEKGLNVRPDGTKIPITLFTYGGPRVGNMKFKERCEKLGVKVLRSVNVHDKVPQVPGVMMNDKNVVAKVVDELLHRSMAYTHVGMQLSLDHAWSSFLKKTNDVTCYHNLEMYLHLVDGYHGKNMKFESATQRDVALVNKSCDFLSEELGLPPNWKQYENKGLVRSADGRLVLPARAPTDGHPPDTHVHLERALQSS